MKDTPIYAETLEDHVDLASTDREFNDLDRMDKETDPTYVPALQHFRQAF